MMTIAEQLAILNNNLDTMDTETDTQSDIIDQIMEVLEGRGAGGEDVSNGEASHMISISIGELASDDPPIYYLDQDGVLNAAPSSSSINALYGLVMFYSNNFELVCTGDYIKSHRSYLRTALFKTSGGTVGLFRINGSTD
jgi:hypothetical protein